MNVIIKNIELPSSKSESNRALMIYAYSHFREIREIRGGKLVQNLSDARDTQLLNYILETLGKSGTIDVEDCGTAARFMLTFLACREGRWLLTGTERMEQRPMQDLILSLRELGADIQCVEKDGFLPVRIKGKSLKGGKVAVDVTHSSQFASSLLLAAPTWPNGLELELKGELNSLPYIDMTINMMRHFGADVERTNRKVVVKPQNYVPKPFLVEPDWSAASYWYEIAALSDDCDILLRNLSLQSPQGDAKMAEMAEKLGVQTVAEKDGLRLKKIPIFSGDVSFDFSNTPDLFPAVVATCAGLGIRAHFTGIKNLSAKESDRVGAMMTELSKIGTKMERISEDELVMLPRLSEEFHYNNLRFNTYNDHRIAMALAPLRLKFGPIEFDCPSVVCKSYPCFWAEFEKCC